MPRGAPSLLIILGLSFGFGLVRTACAADDPAIARARAEEESQRALATQLGSVAAQLAVLGEDMQNNRLDSGRQLAAMHEIVAGLAQLVDRSAAATVRNLPWIEAQLRAVLDGEASAGSLAHAAEGERAVVARLQELVALARRAFAGDELRRDIADLIEAERQIIADTDAAADATVGERRDQESSVERAAQEVLAERQEQLAEGARDAAAELVATAARLTGEDGQAATLREIAADLGAPELDQDIRAAAGSLRANLLTQAEPVETRILALLEHAGSRLGAGAQAHLPSAADRASNQVAKLGEAARRESALLRRVESLPASASAGDTQPLAAAQAAVARALAQCDAGAAAEAHAQMAANLVAQGNPAGAAAAITATIADLHARQQQARDGLAQQTGPPTAARDARVRDPAARVPAMVDAALAQRQGASWIAALPSAERETLQIAASEHFPERYATALAQYYLDLARSPAEQ